MGMKQEPRVGIFWLVDGKLLIDSTALSEAQRYGDALIHAPGHNAVWQRFRQEGIAQREMEYEESPRGRVMYNTKTQRFLLLADKCILKDKSVMKEVMAGLKLPRNKTEKGPDDHYRCGHCLRSKRGDDDF